MIINNLAGNSNMVYAQTLSGSGELCTPTVELHLQKPMHVVLSPTGGLFIYVVTSISLYLHVIYTFVDTVRDVALEITL